MLKGARLATIGTRNTGANAADGYSSGACACMRYGMGAAIIVGRAGIALPPANIEKPAALAIGIEKPCGIARPQGSLVHFMGWFFACLVACDREDSSVWMCRRTRPAFTSRQIPPSAGKFFRAFHCPGKYGWLISECLWRSQTGQ